MPAVKHGLLALLVAAASGCTTIGGERVAGWPKLQVVEHYVPNAVMRDRCAQYVGFFMTPMACAEFDFDARRCDIWYSADVPPPRYVMEHERAHCMGYEHTGEHRMRAMLRNYLSRKDQ